MRTPESSPKSERVLYAIWLIALIATLSSLFFSDIMKLPPCVLCWYQRIAMYPIVLLSMVAMLSNDVHGVMKYLGVLAFSGLIIAGYHNLLYYGILPESLTPCKEGISCTSQQIQWLGFITIPLLSLTSFSLILALLSFNLRKGKTK